MTPWTHRSFPNPCAGTANAAASAPASPSSSLAVAACSGGSGRNTDHPAGRHRLDPARDDGDSTAVGLRGGVPGHPDRRRRHEGRAPRRADEDRVADPGRDRDPVRARCRRPDRRQGRGSSASTRPRRPPFPTSRSSARSMSRRSSASKRTSSSPAATTSTHPTRSLSFVSSSVPVIVLYAPDIETVFSRHRAHRAPRSGARTRRRT